MPILSLVFLTGVLLLLYQSDLPDDYTLFFMFLLGIILVWLGSRWRLLAMLLLGVSWTGLYSAHILSTSLPDELIKQDVIVRGTIEGLVEQRGRVQRFNMLLESLRYQGRAYTPPARVRLSWYEQQHNLAAGQTWQLQVRLKPPHGQRNPGGIDYETWLFQQGIRATGYVRHSGQNQLLKPAPILGIDNLRQLFKDYLARRIGPEGDARAIFPALLLGDRSAMTSHHWQVLRATGTSHLLAISGLHIGIVALLAFVIMRLAVSRFPRALYLLTANQWAALAALLAALIYALMSGFALPAQRALIMVGLFMLATLWRQRVSLGDLLSLALILVLLRDPLSPLSASLWLSFLAVGLLAYGFGGRLVQGPWWQRWSRAQWLLLVGMAAVLVYWFQALSFSAALVNLLAIPWLTLLLWGLLIAVCLPIPFFSDWAMGLCQWWFQWGWNALEWVASLIPSLTVSLGFWQVLLLAIAALVVLLPRGLGGRYLGWAMAVTIFLWPAPQPLADRAYRLTLLDVGQGLAAVVQTRDHVLVFDSGPRFSARFDSGEQVVLPFLRARGIHQVDHLIISHGDNDHIGGAVAIQQGIKVLQVSSSVPDLIPGADVCRRGQVWQWDGVEFRILHPGISGEGLSENNRSCVLLVSAPGGRSLLTGDIEVEAETQLIKRYGSQLHAEVLVAPHHGSKTSSSEGFIRAVAPQYVLFPAGYTNRFGFPHPVVVTRYRVAGARLLNSAYSGAIDFLFHPLSALQYTEYRRQTAHFWSFAASVPWLEGHHE